MTDEVYYDSIQDLIKRIAKGASKLDNRGATLKATRASINMSGLDRLAMVMHVQKAFATIATACVVMDCTPEELLQTIPFGAEKD